MTATLLEMPDLVMSNILEMSDIKTIFTLRKVCHDLRNFIDDNKPDIGISLLRFQISHRFTIEISCKSMNYLKIEYFPEDHDRYNWEPPAPAENEYEVKTENPKELFFDDVARILNFQKSPLVFLDLLLEYFRYIPEWDQFLALLRNNLTSRINPLQVPSFRMSAVEQNDVMLILPLLDQNQIGRIELMSSVVNPWITLERTLEIDQILELPHFKIARELDMKVFVLPSGVEKFLHFAKANFHLKTITTRDLLLVREKFRNPSILMTIYEIKYNRLIDRQKFIEKLGYPLVFPFEYNRGPEYPPIMAHQWYLRMEIPDTVLFITHVPLYHQFSIFRDHIGCVPEGAIIQ